MYTRRCSNLYRATPWHHCTYKWLCITLELGQILLPTIKLLNKILIISTSFWRKNCKFVPLVIPLLVMSVLQQICYPNWTQRQPDSTLGCLRHSSGTSFLHLLRVAKQQPTAVHPYWQVWKHELIIWITSKDQSFF